MSNVLLDQWILALRSGKYEQGHYALCYDNKFCCLGVLCDLSKRGEWLACTAGNVSYYVVRGEVRQKSDAPYLVWDQVSNDLLLKQTDLIRFNDAERKTFNEIADIIQAHRTDMLPEA